MRTFLKNLIVALCFACASALGVAQPTASSASASAPVAAAAAAAEIAALRAQIETTKQFQDSFITMAQWALGTAVAVALALSVFAWQSNKTTYERDRESLAREAKNLAAELRTELQTQIAERSKEVVDSLGTKEKSIADALSKTLDARIALVKGKLSDIEDDIQELQEKDLAQQAQMWTDKDVQSNALAVLAELLVHQIKRESGEYFLSETLNKILEISKDSSKSIGADTYAAVNDAIEKLPRGLRGACDPILANLKRKLG